MGRKRVLTIELGREAVVGALKGERAAAMKQALAVAGALEEQEADLQRSREAGTTGLEELEHEVRDLQLQHKKLIGSANWHLQLAEFVEAGADLSLARMRLVLDTEIA